MKRDINGFLHLEPKRYSIQKLLTREKRKLIVFRHGHIALTDYKMGDNKEFEKSLSVFDEIYWKYELKGGYYVKELREFRINRGYDVSKLREFFPDRKPIVDNDAYPYDEIDVKLYAAPRSDIQRVALTFLMGEGEFKSNHNYTQQMLDMDTGDGKTFCGVTTPCYYHGKVIVIVPFQKLLNQWKESFIKFTSIRESEISIIQGSKECQKILEGKYQKTKVFLFMLDTIYSFHKKYGDLETMELLRATRCYIKIVDEIHRDMKAIAMIEAMSNFRMNFYMSASPGRTHKKEAWIFKTLFCNIPRFGSGFKTQAEKHLNIVVKQYVFVPDSQQIHKIINKRKGWLNGKSYETQLIESPKNQRSNFDQSVIVMTKWARKQLKDGNKILILCNTIAGTEYLKNLLSDLFPNEVSQYYGSMPSAEEKRKALEKTIVCATTSSLGTGADIKGLQFCFNVTTYTSEIDLVQISGRCRAIPGVDVVYCEFVNIGWYKTIKQYEKRRALLAKRSKTNSIITIQPY